MTRAGSHNIPDTFSHRAIRSCTKACSWKAGPQRVIAGPLFWSSAMHERWGANVPGGDYPVSNVLFERSASRRRNARRRYFFSAASRVCACASSGTRAGRRDHGTPCALKRFSLPHDCHEGASGAGLSTNRPWVVHFRGEARFRTNVLRFIGTNARASLHICTSAIP